MPFSGLNLKVGKKNYNLSKMGPIWAICTKSGQNFSRSGQEKIILLIRQICTVLHAYEDKSKSGLAHKAVCRAKSWLQVNQNIIAHYCVIVHSLFSHCFLIITCYYKWNYFIVMYYDSNNVPVITYCYNCYYVSVTFFYIGYCIIITYYYYGYCIIIACSYCNNESFLHISTVITDPFLLSLY